MDRRRVRGNLFLDFQALPSNHGALQLAEEFADGRAPFGIIEGVPGWGKTHLLSAANDTKSNASFRVASVSALAFISPSPQITEAQVLLVDDLHLAESRPRVRQMLCFELERRRRMGRPTLCACSSPLPASLNLRKSWRRETLAEPSAEERKRVLERLCQLEQLTIPEHLAGIVSSWVSGDGSTLRGVARQLKLSRINLPQCHPLRLAGFLYTQYGPSGEDLRDTVLNAAAVSAMKDEKSRRPYTLQQLAVYLMRVEANLAEEKVADYFGAPQALIYADQRQAESLLAHKSSEMRQSVVRALDVLQDRIRPK